MTPPQAHSRLDHDCAIWEQTLRDLVAENGRLKDENERLRTLVDCFVSGSTVESIGEDQ